MDEPDGTAAGAVGAAAFEVDERDDGVFRVDGTDGAPAFERDGIDDAGAFGVGGLGRAAACGGVPVRGDGGTMATGGKALAGREEGSGAARDAGAAGSPRRITIRPFVSPVVSRR